MTALNDTEFMTPVDNFTPDQSFETDQQDALMSDDEQYCPPEDLQQDTEFMDEVSGFEIQRCRAQEVLSQEEEAEMIRRIRNKDKGVQHPAWSVQPVRPGRCSLPCIS